MAEREYHISIEQERLVKWPDEVTLVRHGMSNFKALKDIQQVDPDYQDFKTE